MQARQRRRNSAPLAASATTKPTAVQPTSQQREIWSSLREQVRPPVLNAQQFATLCRFATQALQDADDVLCLRADVARLSHPSCSPGAQGAQSVAPEASAVSASEATRTTAVANGSSAVDATAAAVPLRSARGTDGPTIEREMGVLMRGLMMKKGGGSTGDNARNWRKGGRRNWKMRLFTLVSEPHELRWYQPEATAADKPRGSLRLTGARIEEPTTPVEEEREFRINIVEQAFVAHTVGNSATRTLELSCTSAEQRSAWLAALHQGAARQHGESITTSVCDDAVTGESGPSSGVGTKNIVPVTIASAQRSPPRLPSSSPPILGTAPSESAATPSLHRTSPSPSRASAASVRDLLGIFDGSGVTDARKEAAVKSSPIPDGLLGATSVQQLALESGLAAIDLSKQMQKQIPSKSAKAAQSTRVDTEDTDDDVEEAPLVIFRDGGRARSTTRFSDQLHDVVLKMADMQLQSTSPQKMQKQMVTLLQHTSVEHHSGRSRSRRRAATSVRPDECAVAAAAGQPIDFSTELAKCERELHRTLHDMFRNKKCPEGATIRHYIKKRFGKEHEKSGKAGSMVREFINGMRAHVEQHHGAVLLAMLPPSAAGASHSADMPGQDTMAVPSGLTPEASSLETEYMPEATLYDLVNVALEESIVQPLLRRILASTRKSSAQVDKRDRSFRLALKHYATLSQAEIGVTKAFISPSGWKSACDACRQLSIEAIPSQQLLQILDVARAIYTTFDEEKPAVHSKKVLAADDFLPVFIFVIAQSGIEDLYLMTENLQALGDDAALADEAGYYLTSAYLACAYMIDCKVD